MYKNKNYKNNCVCKVYFYDILDYYVYESYIVDVRTTRTRKNLI